MDGALSGTIILGAHFLGTHEPTQTHISVGTQSILMHPSWSPILARNDIALVRFPTHVQLIPGVIYPVNLPRAAHVGQSFAGYSGQVSGWGVFSDSQGSASDVLRFVYNNIMANQGCFPFFPLLQSTMICLEGANGRGPCMGGI